MKRNIMIFTQKYDKNISLAGFPLLPRTAGAGRE